MVRPRRVITLSIAIALALLAIGLYMTTRHEAWLVSRTSSTAPLPNVELRQVVFRNAEKGEFNVTALRFDRRIARAELTDLVDQRSQRLEMARVIRTHNAFAAVGLRVINGTTTCPPTDGKPYSGYVSIDRRGTLDVSVSAPAGDTAPFVLQSGPFLIDPGGAIGIRPPRAAQLGEP